MDHIPSLPPTAATHEPAVPSTPHRRVPYCRVSNQLAESLVDAAADSLVRAPRPDGWTPDRIRAFLTTLAECGVVGDACRAAGMSRQSAYAFRNRASGRAFHIAWNAAEQLGRRRLEGAVVSRALNGCVEVIVRGDEVIERHRFDNRHTMAVLTRLDQRVLARDDEARTARLVAEEFDQFVDIVCAGGKGAAEFVASRVENDRFTATREARTLDRCDNYARYGVGLPGEIDVSDLDPEAQESWTAEQRERAERAGLFDELEDEAEESLEDDTEEALEDDAEDALEDDSEGGSPVATIPAEEMGGKPGGRPVNVVWLPPTDPPAGDGAADPPAAPAGAGPSGGDPSGPDPEAPPPDPAAEPSAAVDTREKATCLPEQYDPRSGLAPPDGWVPPNR